MKTCHRAPKLHQNISFADILTSLSGRIRPFPASRPGTTLWTRETSPRSPLARICLWPRPAPRFLLSPGASCAPEPETDRSHFTPAPPDFLLIPSRKRK